MNKIKLCRLSRYLEDVWFNRLLQDLQAAESKYELAVKQLLTQYDQDRYMKEDAK